MKLFPGSINIATTIEWNRRLRTTYAAASSVEFIKAAFELLRATVSCDLLLFHDLGEKEHVPLVQASNGKQYYFNSMTELLMSAPRTTRCMPNIVSSPTALPQARQAIQEGPIFSEVLGPLKIRHGVSILFRRAPKTDSLENAFSILRSSNGQEFSSQDLALLENTHGHLETAMNCLKSRLALDSKQEGLAAIIRELPLGSIVLDWHLQVVHANRKGLEHCSAWLHAPVLYHLKLSQRNCRIPEDITAACRDLQREWTLNIRAPESSRLRKARHLQHHCDPTLQATVTLLGSHASALFLPSFLIQIERDTRDTSSARNFRGPGFDRLTLSEQEVTLCAVNGLSNQEIADELGKTISAVKFLLHSTFRKLQVPSRAQLIARLRQ